MLVRLENHKALTKQRICKLQYNYFAKILHNKLFDCEYLFKN